MIVVKLILNLFFLVFFTISFIPFLISADCENNYQRNDILDIINEMKDDEKYLDAQVKIGEINLRADVAVTELQKQKGLSIKESLEENEAMLFVFQIPYKQSFWMKDMKFPIDIIWVDENDKIVHIESSLQPCSTWTLFCTSYHPPHEALYVLETVSGFTNNHDIKEGDEVYFTIIRHNVTQTD